MSTVSIHRPRAEGFVLIAVLSVMALLSGIAIIMLTSSRNSVDIAAIESSDIAADAMIQSGISIAAYQLFVLKSPPERINMQQIRLDRGTVTLTASTDAAKVDLNTSSKTLLEAAYQAAGLKTLSPQSFAARVADWRDADDDMSDDGAETAQYEAAGLSYAPANRPFRSTADLQWVPGISAADIKTLSDFVTVYNPRGRLDVFSASAALIAALPNVDADTVARVIAVRKERNAASIAKLDDILLVQSALIDGQLPSTYRVRLQVNVNEARGPRNVDVVLASGATAGSGYEILQWIEQGTSGRGNGR